ncbi:DUF2993 domain-containing protein [Corynebacterium liangguodongii]|uniref:DUF2993 domain-containing protein n=1 Tax=Corynebacterium liangguodongii TaxID=2079535 RepID=A0A2S0WFS9_9CORY|nr:DUF2993 domain-containing protein [Corynebacterium liangguodongii]AWB84610.1 DUF2993 domain-containing protein [Corynebacterium liangguodongii]PWB99618.1 DUF2993 domain-containing protein [Corynebacterium liangguodongii]
MRLGVRSRLTPRAACALVVALLAALCADTIAAARVERSLSLAAAAHSGLETPPDAYVAGFPFSQVALTSKVPRITVSALDVDVAGLGTVNITAEAFDVRVPAERAFAADFAGAKATMVRRRVRLDGVAFGELLGMTDLDISHPYDISPTGGTASEAQLTGTVPGTSEPSAVVVTLRLENGRFLMRPSVIISAPPGATDAILAAYTLERDTSELPLGGPADLVQLSGGSIEFSHQELNVALSDTALAPLGGT